ncbi:hypothetical protein ACHAWF_003619, partial [Thalassiosira exigua]
SSFVISPPTRDVKVSRSEVNGWAKAVARIHRKPRASAGNIMPLSLQIVKRKLVEGELLLDYQDLTARDAIKILKKLNSGRPSKIPRRCRQITETLESEVIRNLSSESNVRKISLFGNERLGEKVTGCLHLLPDTVRYIDLSYCGLTPFGIHRTFWFMETNKTISHLIMRGNNILNVSALFIIAMLKENTTLQELCCYSGGFASVNDVDLNDDELSLFERRMDWFGMTFIAKSLEHNRTLRVLRLAHSFDSMDMEVSRAFRKSLEIAGNNSAIETLEVGNFHDGYLLDDWAHTFEKCENLCDVGKFSSSWLSHPKVTYWRDLNKYKARRLTREGSPAEIQSAVEKAAKKEKLMWSITYCDTTWE